MKVTVRLKGLAWMRPSKAADFECVNKEEVMAAFGATEIFANGTAPRDECDCSDEEYKEMYIQDSRNTHAARAVKAAVNKAIDVKHNHSQGTFEYVYDAGDFDPRTGMTAREHRMIDRYGWGF